MKGWRPRCCRTFCSASRSACWKELAPAPPAWPWADCAPGLDRQHRRPGGRPEHKTVDDTSNLHLKFKTRVTADILESLLSGPAEGTEGLGGAHLLCGALPAPGAFREHRQRGPAIHLAPGVCTGRRRAAPEWCDFEYSTCTLLPAAAEAAGQARARALMPFPMFHHNEHFGFIVLERARRTTSESCVKSCVTDCGQPAPQPAGARGWTLRASCCAWTWSAPARPTKTSPTSPCVTP